MLSVVSGVCVLEGCTGAKNKPQPHLVWLGVAFTFMGFACFLAGLVFIGYISKFSGSNQSAKNCPSFMDATNFWLAGLQFRHATYFSGINNNIVTEANTNDAFGMKLGANTSFLSGGNAYVLSSFMGLDTSNSLRAAAK